MAVTPVKEEWQWTKRDVVLAATAIVVIGSLLAYDQKLAHLALTFPCFAFGAVGIARRRITLGGRGGRNPRLYTGVHGVLASLPFFIGGGALTLWNAARIWPNVFAALLK